MFYRFSPCSPPVPLPTSIRCSNSVLLPAPPPLTLEAKEQSGSDQALIRKGLALSVLQGGRPLCSSPQCLKTSATGQMVLLTCCNLKGPVCKIWPDL